ncbi:MAG: four helix bundle protein [Chlorobi bacterium]|nr:four helix bundle protein [Chlorobiota bacterium]
MIRGYYIIEYTELLDKDRKYVIAKQILKSGTSIGANIREAQSAESKADFIHKLKISDKEAEETAYWLQLCKLSKSYPDPADLETKLLEIK